MSRINNHNWGAVLAETAQSPYPETADRWQSFDDWERLTPQREIVRGVFVEGQPAVVGGYKGCLKTLLTLDMVIAAATGTPWLGHAAFAVDQPLRVGFVSCESGKRTLGRKYRLMLNKRMAVEPARAAEVEALCRQNLHPDDRLIDLGTEAGVRETVEIARLRQKQILVIDPLHNFFGSMAKDAANTPALSVKIADLSQRLADIGCTPIFVAHTAGDRNRTQQGNDYRPLNIMDLAWPGVYNAVRQYVMVSRVDAFEKETRTSRLWLNIGGSALTDGGLFQATATEGVHHDRWDTRVQPATVAITSKNDSRSAAKATADREDRERLLRYLQQQYPSGDTINHMTTGTERPTMLAGMGHKKSKDLLHELEARGQVISRPEQRGNDPRAADVWYYVPPCCNGNTPPTSV